MGGLGYFKILLKAVETILELLEQNLIAINHPPFQLIIALHYHFFVKVQANNISFKFVLFEKKKAFCSVLVKFLLCGGDTLFDKLLHLLKYQIIKRLIFLIISKHESYPSDIWPYLRGKKADPAIFWKSYFIKLLWAINEDSLSTVCFEYRRSTSSFWTLATKGDNLPLLKELN